MSKMNIILVARRGWRLDRYLQLLRGYDVAVDRVTDPRDVFVDCLEKKYAGLMLDLTTVMKSHGAKKKQLEEIGHKFPMIRLHIHPADGRVVGLMYGAEGSGAAVIDAFMKKCRDFKPCRIRSGHRLRRILNVLVFKEYHRGGQGALKANTLNISLDGCFITTLHPFNKSDRLQVWIKEMALDSRLECEVRWSQPWGIENRLPGVGLHFIGLKDEAKSALDPLIRS
jgi:hypothetical protein